MNTIFMTKQNSKGNIVGFFIFLILFTSIFFLNKNSAEAKFNSENVKYKGIETSSAEQVKDIISSYGMFSSILFGGIALVITSILYFVIKKIKKSMHISIIISYLFLLVFAIELVFFENRYTAWANGIIFYIGLPLLYSSLMIILGTIVLSLFKKGEAHE